MFNKKLTQFQKDFLWLLGSNVRYPILRWTNDLERKKQKPTISQLHKILSIERKRTFGEKGYDYKTIHKQVIQLVQKNYLKLKQEDKKQGKPVIVKIKDKEKTIKILNKFNDFFKKI